MNRLTGVLALSKRELLRFLVVWQQTLVPPLLLSLLFIFIFGLSVGQHIRGGMLGVSYLQFIVPGLVTMHLASSSFENTSSSLFISRWHNHIQEVLLSPLSYFEMVIGLLAGGVARGMLTATGVLCIASFFEPLKFSHPFLLIYFMLAITISFSCLGMIAALWANDWGMLSVWNTYCITPLVFLGGVFNPVSMLPEKVRFIVKFNPIHYLVSGMRYCVLDVVEAPLIASITLAGCLALGLFLLTVHLFRIGYKLRT